jgi:phycoerythrin-associated linker protein
MTFDRRSSAELTDSHKTKILENAMGRIDVSPNAVELTADRTADNVQTAIRAVYKQVLGNPHVMDSERLTTAESQLADRAFSVREFVRAVGKSEFYHLSKIC